MAASQDDFRYAILAELGSAPEQVEAGQLQRFSTNGRPTDTAGWCLLFSDGRAGKFGDHRTGVTAKWRANQREPLSAAQVAEHRQRALSAAASRALQQRAGWHSAKGRTAALWDACISVPVDGTGGDPLSTYLRHRLAVAATEPLKVPKVLRLHPGLPYHHDGSVSGCWPAMVASLQAPDGSVTALHRTWLTLDGHKAPTPGPSKKLTKAAGPVMGSCIRLGWPNPIGSDTTMGIAEGIETALAAYMGSGIPTVAAYCANNLANWVWPRGLRRLVIFADADEAGIKAADALRSRTRAACIRCDILTPGRPGADWADVWSQRETLA